MPMTVSSTVAWLQVKTCLYGYRVKNCPCLSMCLVILETGGSPACCFFVVQPMLLTFREIRPEDADMLIKWRTSDRINSKMLTNG